MTPEDFHATWDRLAALTMIQHPDADLEDWLVHEAKGILVHPLSDPDPTISGRIEWIA